MSKQCWPASGTNIAMQPFSDRLQPTHLAAANRMGKILKSIQQDWNMHCIFCTWLCILINFWGQQLKRALGSDWLPAQSVQSWHLACVSCLCSCFLTPLLLLSISVWMCGHASVLCNGRVHHQACTKAYDVRPSKRLLIKNESHSYIQLSHSCLSNSQTSYL